jgi:hypothetical protein
MRDMTSPASKWNRNLLEKLKDRSAFQGILRHFGTQMSWTVSENTISVRYHSSTPTHPISFRYTYNPPIKVHVSKGISFIGGILLKILISPTRVICLANSLLLNSVTIIVLVVVCTLRDRLHYVTFYTILHIISQIFPSALCSDANNDCKFTPSSTLLSRYCSLQTIRHSPSEIM